MARSSSKQKSHIPDNGFGPAIVRLGKRVLIDELEWFRCIARQNGRSVPESSGDDIPNLLSVRDFCAKHPAWTEPAIRNIIFYARRVA